MRAILFTLMLVFVFYSFTPPGTVKIKPGFYMDKGEIRISDWKEYLYYLKRNSNLDNYVSKVKDAMPDSVAFKAAYHVSFSKNQKLEDEEAPMVGISYDQASAYCKWRSEVVEIKYHKKVEYRLPTVDEWIAFASNGGSNMSGSQMDSSIQLYPLCENYRDVHRLKTSHLDDNVSEMTAEKGIAMGNNFTDKEKGLSRHEYTKPEKWLGFRCVCQVGK